MTEEDLVAYASLRNPLWSHWAKLLVDAKDNCRSPNVDPDSLSGRSLND